MSRFLSKRLSDLIPYTPGEQPKNMEFIKLNTNESPFPPSPKAKEFALAEFDRLQLYPDPEAGILRECFARVKEVQPENVVFSNGSDDLLNFAFMAFCDDETGAAFADITYGFYPVFADLNHINYREIPLKEDFSLDLADYYECGRTVFIANPNAPTGAALPVDDIEKVLKHNRENIVVIDEAYVDFGAQSCIPLTKEYDNLLVIGTFSKSRNFAGGRLGYGVGCEELIRDINTIRFSTNPYDIDRLNMAAAVGILNDPDYMDHCCGEIVRNRIWTSDQLKKLGFTMTDSRANFIFAKAPDVSGEELYLKLRKRGILVRHFPKERIKDHLRITVGTKEQMTALIDALGDILAEGVK